MQDVLYMIVPCFNEENVLPLTAGSFLREMEELVRKEKISPESRILFVNDGSTDRTWEVIRALALEDERYRGMSLAGNCGKPLALKAGMKEALELGADLVVSPDSDGQDDPGLMEAMVDEAREGSRIVYGLPSGQTREGRFHRKARELACRLLGRRAPGLNAARGSYRLVTRSLLKALSDSDDVRLYLEGLYPGAGFETADLPYERKQRAGGRSRKGGSKKTGSVLEEAGRRPGLIFPLLAAIGLMICLLTLTGILRDPGVPFWSFLCGLQLAGIGAAGVCLGRLLRAKENRSGYVITSRTWDRERKEGAEPREEEA